MPGNIASRMPGAPPQGRDATGSILPQLRSTQPMNPLRPKAADGWLTLTLAAAYAGVLAVLLWTSDPFCLAGSGQGVLRHWYRTYLEPVAHLVAFVPLGCLLVAGRWPMRRRIVLGALVAYALASELLQGLVPQRTVQWADTVQNVSGLLLGAALAVAARYTTQSSAARCGPSTSSLPD
jgi:VanZ family protein